MALSQRAGLPGYSDCHGTVEDLLKTCGLCTLNEGEWVLCPSHWEFIVGLLNEKLDPHSTPLDVTVRTDTKTP